MTDAALEAMNAAVPASGTLHAMDHCSLLRLFDDQYTKYIITCHVYLQSAHVVKMVLVAVFTGY